MVAELFLYAALALPALPWNQDKIYDELVRRVSRYRPELTVVLVHKDEELLNPEAMRTPLLFRSVHRVWILIKPKEK